MRGVAEFIRRRGRISIAELAGRSNELIDLEAKVDEGGGGAAAALDLLGEVPAVGA